MKILKKIINDEDLKETSFNFILAFGTGHIANIISNAFFDFNLNEYNSIDHLAIGVGIGTFAYRKAGRGFRGVLAGLTAATLFNAGWEFAEYKGIYENRESLIDTISDIGVIYGGSILSFLGEKLKFYIKRK